MCCRRKVSKTLTITFSVLSALGGLCVISFCFKLLVDTDDIVGDSNVAVLDKSEQDARTTDLTPTEVSPLTDSKREDQELDDISKRISIIAFLVGVSAIVFGLAGICTTKIRRWPCTCTFGFCAFLATALYTTGAAILLSLYYVSEEQITDFCNNDLNLDDTEGVLKRMIQEIEDYVYTVDEELNYAVNSHMCTDYCPCVGDWDYSIYGTSQGVIFSEHETNDYNFNGTQTIFTECYAQRKTIWIQQDPDHVAIDESVVDFVRTLEQEYDCSGLCQYATFWASKDITTGPPKQACIYSLKESFDDNMVLLGWAMVATALMTLMVFCCHCGLYLRKDIQLQKTLKKKRFIFD